MDGNQWVEQHVSFPFFRAHNKLYQRSNGRIGHRVPGMPRCLLLHTTGAKTGQPRTNTLAYAHDGADYLIVASNAGAENYPGWYHNLRAHPEPEINIGTKRFGVTAKRVMPGEPDYDRLWEIANKNTANRYDGYQRRTPRPIPVFILTPRR